MLWEVAAVGVGRPNILHVKSTEGQECDKGKHNSYSFFLLSLQVQDKVLSTGLV